MSDHPLIVTPHVVTEHASLIHYYDTTYNYGWWTICRSSEWDHDRANFPTREARKEFRALAQAELR